MALRVHWRETLRLVVGLALVVVISTGVILVGLRAGVLGSNVFTVLEAAAYVLLFVGFGVARVLQPSPPPSVDLDGEGFLWTSPGTRIVPSEVSTWEVPADREHFVRVRGACDALLPFSGLSSRVDVELGPFGDPTEARELAGKLAVAAMTR
ncbi:MAG: hypothetical protein KC731_39555 [Myxococcales bacterium]|nr:hypothetical protein [Myxococcales bacterium]